jgi:hypothetical protein
MDEDYLNLFKQNNQNNGFQKLNETTNYEQWENLNEKPNQQYNIYENVNDGWSTDSFVVETRINGIPQTQNPNQLRPNSRRHMQVDPNGLNQFIDEDDDLREVKRNPYQQPVQPVQQTIQPPQVADIKDVDVVSIDMFENMNSNALLTLANNRISKIDVSKVTNTADDRQVRFLGS